METIVVADSTYFLVTIDSFLDVAHDEKTHILKRFMVFSGIKLYQDT